MWAGAPLSSMLPAASHNTALTNKMARGPMDMLHCTCMHIQAVDTAHVQDDHVVLGGVQMGCRSQLALP